MTNSPGEGQPPQEPGQPNQPDQPDQPGYWEQQQLQQPAYGQPAHERPAPYGQPPGYPVQYAPDHPQATTSLVLGILGIVVCGIIAPFAWRMGKRTVDEIDASQGQVGGRGAAQAGYVLGIIGSVLLGLGLLVVVLLLIIGLVPLLTSGSVSTSQY